MSTASGTVGGGQSVRRLVGREGELTRILSAVDTILAGTGRVVLLSGEPGVGKTRLAQEVLAQACERRMRVLVGRCFEQHTSVPFLPFSEALTTALVGAPQDLQADARQHWPELVHLLPEFNSGAVPPTLNALSVVVYVPLSVALSA